MVKLAHERSASGEARDTLLLRVAFANPGGG